MSEIVSHQTEGNISIIKMDDGKANAVSFTLLDQLHAALDRAEEAGQTVVIIGRPGKFSAGFDLSVMGQGGEAMGKLVAKGALLASRLLAFPTPVVMACNGHGLAMGGLMLLSADYRIGVSGAFKVGLNEVAIGMTMPLFGVELARARLAPAHVGRAVINAEMYSPQASVMAGFLDHCVDSEEALLPAALNVATTLSQLSMPAHAGTKLRVRALVLEAVDAAIEKEFAAFLR